MYKVHITGNGIKHYISGVIKPLYLKNVKCSGEPKNMAALTLYWMGQPSFYHATVALSFQIEICNLDRGRRWFPSFKIIFKKVIFIQNLVKCPSSFVIIIAISEEGNSFIIWVIYRLLYTLGNISRVLIFRDYRGFSAIANQKTRETIFAIVLYAHFATRRSCVLDHVHKSHTQQRPGSAFLTGYISTCKLSFIDVHVNFAYKNAHRSARI